MNYETVFKSAWTLVVSRLRSLKEKGKTLQQIGDMLDVNKSTIGRWISEERGGDKTAAVDLFRYMESLGISFEEAFRFSIVSDAEYAFVPRALARPAMGGGSLQTSGETEGALAFRREWISRKTRTSPERLRVMLAEGESMHPTIDNNDIVLVDEGGQGKELIEGRVYVIRKGEEIFVKRFRKGVGELLFMGDNRGTEYHDVKVRPGDEDGFAVIGRVLWAGKEL